MKEIIIAVCAVALGVALGLIWAAAGRNAERRRRRKRGGRERPAGLERETPRPETMKRFVWACVLNGFAWVWCSYILAYLDKPQIAEELSKVALVEIIVPVAVYALKSGVENLSKNNRWQDKQPADTETAPDQNDTGGGGAVG